MSEMVERVASTLIRTFVEKGGTNAHEVARAAIAAMREPTKEMIYHGNETVGDCIDFWNYDSGAGYSVEPHAARDTWQAMIDEILSAPVEAEQRL